jgi:uncharacterized membrane protein YebE (DUF533 family)
MDNKKIMFIGLAVVGIGIVGYLAYQKFGKPKTDETDEETDEETNVEKPKLTAEQIEALKQTSNLLSGIRRFDGEEEFDADFENRNLGL